MPFGNDVTNTIVSASITCTETSFGPAAWFPATHVMPGSACLQRRRRDRRERSFVGVHGLRGFLRAEQLALRAELLGVVDGLDGRVERVVHAVLRLHPDEHDRREQQHDAAADERHLPVELRQRVLLLGDRDLGRDQRQEVFDVARCRGGGRRGGRADGEELVERRRRGRVDRVRAGPGSGAAASRCAG